MVATRTTIKAQHGSAEPPKGSAAEPDLRCLAGLRALASWGVLALHSFMYWQFFLAHQTKYELTQRNLAVKAASAGMAWVDVLLVLSAALAAFHLIPQMEDRRGTARSCAQVVLGYWGRRARRILPAYLATNLLAAVALGPDKGLPPEAAAARWIHFFHCPRQVWANLLFVQNFFGTKACAIQLWTVAVQMQFYLVFPLALWALRPRSPGFRARLAAALLAAWLGSTAWRVWAAWHAEFMELPVADFAVDQRSQQSWAHMLLASYLPTASRVTELAAGAAVGLVLRWPAAVKQLHDRRLLVGSAALALQGSYIYLLLNRHLLFRAPGAAPWPPTAVRLHVSLLSWGSPFVAALVATTLLALTLHADPLHAACARLLGASAWHPAAELSYALFLAHEQARLWLVLLLPAGWLPRFVVAWPVSSLAVVTAGTLLAGYATALPLHHFIERPWLGSTW